jgi:hypothetical protein
MVVGSKESCKLVGAAQRIAATESHLIPNLSAKGFKEGDCEESGKLTSFIVFCVHKICKSWTNGQ